MLLYSNDDVPFAHNSSWRDKLETHCRVSVTFRTCILLRSTNNQKHTRNWSSLVFPRKSKKCLPDCHEKMIPTAGWLVLTFAKSGAKQVAKTISEFLSNPVMKAASPTDPDSRWIRLHKGGNKYPFANAPDISGNPIWPLDGLPILPSGYFDAYSP